MIGIDVFFCSHTELMHTDLVQVCTNTTVQLTTTNYNSVFTEEGQICYC